MTTFNALNFPIRITQGNDWDFPATVSTRLNDVTTPIDLTAATIVGTVRPNYTSGVIVSMTVTPVNLAQGQFRLTLTDTQTNSLPVGALVYEVTITISGFTTTYLAGNFIVKPKVSLV